MLGLNVIGIQCANLLESFNIADICPWVYDYLGIPCGLRGLGMHIFIVGSVIFHPAPANRKKHMACCKKYKPYILEQVPFILK